jgi:hypothetical protein
MPALPYFSTYFAAATSRAVLRHDRH